MATLVVSTPFAGAVQQVQIGPADMVATVTAAHSAWGWVGGLNGILSILRLSVRPSEEKKMQQLFEAIEPGLASCQILGQHGLETIALPEDQAFGSSLSSKLVGMTFCALAFTMQPKCAIRIFMEFFVDALFKKGLCNYPGSTEALQTFLTDNHPAILNEGSIHHLPEKFQGAISRFETVTGLRGTSHPKLQAMSMKPTDAPLINGFLKWLTRDIRDPYYTRSAAVARIAECLRCVGYKLGKTAIWDGIGQRPSLHRTLILVTGGASETDDLMESSGLHDRTHDLTTHYKWNTAGAMLWNSLVHDCDYPPETFQEDFDDIKSTLEISLRFRWAHLDANEEQIHAFPVWTNSRPSPSPAATRIATIFFPESVDQVSTLYQRVSSKKYLKAALAEKQTRPREIFKHSGEFQRIQVVTASICLAVLGKLGGSDFEAIQHSTMLDLSDMANIRWLCGEVDAILSGGCGMSRVITALAAIHCAAVFPQGAVWGSMDFNAASAEQKLSDTQLVGWRNGRYAILPNLLFSMERPLEKSVLDLRCVDTFIANLPTRRNGTICCQIGLPGTIAFSNEFLKDMVTQEGRELEEQKLAHGETRPTILGPAMIESPDKPLYITLERPPYGSGEPEISVCGRLGGESLGHVGIQDILIALALSWHDAEARPYEACSPGKQHEKQPQASNGLPADMVLNMTPSTYFRHPGVTPSCNVDQEPRHHVYVQVAGNTPWTLFLAGQNTFLNRIVFGCPDCAVHAGANHITDTSNGLRASIGWLSVGIESTALACNSEILV